MSKSDTDVSHVTEGGTFICHPNEIVSQSSKGFLITHAGEQREIFLVRDVRGLHGYLNRCPHTGSPLDWLPDQFLSLDKTEIQCATHDARFRIGDGVCISGPCLGDRLTPLALKVTEQSVYLTAW